MTLRHNAGLVLMSAALAGCASNSANPSAPSSSEEAGSSPSYEADTSAMEVDLEGQIDEKLNVVGTQVECPSYVVWQVGDSFHCDVTAPGSPPGFAEVTLDSDDGKYRWYISNQ